MSHVFYSTRLFWVGSRGIAKLHGICIHLVDAPVLCGVIVEVDYTPEVGVARCRDRFGGWRDMERGEIEAADKFLRRATLPTGC